MDKRLSIQLILGSDCKLVAIDNSSYYNIGEDFTSHYMLEFLTYNFSEIPLPETIRLRRGKYHREQYTNLFSSEFILKRDGSHSYYKLFIPELEHFRVDSEGYNNLKDELFFYNDKLYKSNLLDDNYYSKVKVIEQSVEISYIDAYKFIQKGFASQSFYCPEKIIFNMCNLQRCLVSLQKSLIFNKNINCGEDKCSENKLIRDRRDFILSSLYVLDYLKDIKNFTEAQRILDNLSTCYSICGYDNNPINDCGCGSSI